MSHMHKSINIFYISKVLLINNNGSRIIINNSNMIDKLYIREMVLGNPSITMTSFMSMIVIIAYVIAFFIIIIKDWRQAEDGIRDSPE